MELKELREIIKNSPHFETLNQLELNFELPHIQESYELKGLINIYKFFQEQKNSWLHQILIKENNLFADSSNFFNTAIQQLDSFISQYANNGSYSTNNLTFEFNKVLRYLTPNNLIFTAKSSAVDFLTTLSKKDNELYSSAFNYITGKNFNIYSKKNLEGFILAYEFENKENSQIFNRRESEKKSLGKIKSEILSLGNTFENEVIKFQKKIEEDYSSYRNNEDNTINKSRKILADWLQFKKSNYESFVSSTNSQFQNLFKNTNEEFINLQNQYGELLKLQEPIQYWKDRATELNKKANQMLIWLGIVSFIFAVLVYILLWFTPEGLLESIFNGDKSKAIRWSFVFVIFVSIFFVVVRALLKFMFSNFHLARDAEEREKLTYLYISLLNKGDINAEERNIVFQALFSRSDTGLLKEDSSPTMPGVGSVFEKLK